MEEVRGIFLLICVMIGLAVIVACAWALACVAVHCFLEWIRKPAREEGEHRGMNASDQYWEAKILATGFAEQDKVGVGWRWKTRQQVAAEFVAEAGKGSK